MAENERSIVRARQVVLDHREMRRLRDAMNKRIAVGLALLDEHVPGWPKKMRLDEFRFSRGNTCVLGQTFEKVGEKAGTYANGYESIVGALGDARRGDPMTYWLDGDRAAKRFVKAALTVSEDVTLGEIGFTLPSEVTGASQRIEDEISYAASEAIDAWAWAYMDERWEKEVRARLERV